MRRTSRVIAALWGCLLANAATAVGQEEAPAVPSGLAFSLQEYFIDMQPDGVRLARFRFVSADLVNGIAFAQVEHDFPVLCAEYALPALVAAQEQVSQVVVSMASEAVEFGASDPSVTQFFEAFRIESGLCIWEGF
ncbi:DUF6497 family protein [Thalassovita sp.]|uniref:DUF6497 family protein n=1 Tax=Thalassovita sp. TaxID=1979401 RepID=UPI0029DE7E5E|nr:DUF6497 family protein [Thalassovita sp.]